jgi:hypothetical protein
LPIDQPLYLLLPVWGEKYVRTALDLCIASLLSPGNLPAVQNPTTVVLRTTSRSRRMFEADPMFARLREHVEIHWLHMTDPARDAPKMKLMSECHAIGARMAHEAGALVMFLTADIFHVDGSIPRLIRWAQAPGIRVVMASAWAASQEAFMAAIGAAPGEPLAIPHRRAASLLVKHMHSAFRQYEVWGPAFGPPLIMVCPWWRATEDGVLSHSLSWSIAMMNYARIEHHDTTCLDKWTVDGDHAYRNAPEPSQWHVITDSDDHLLLGLTREADQNFPPTVNPKLAHAPDPINARRIILRATRHRKIMCQLKKRLFEVPIFVHGSPLSANPAAWANAERDARDMIAGTQEPLEQEVPGEIVYPPFLLDAINGVNFVDYAGRIWAVPQSLGALELDNDEHRARPGISSFDSLDEARAAVGTRKPLAVSGYRVRSWIGRLRRNLLAS